MAGRAYCKPEGRYVETNAPADRDVVLRYRHWPRGTFACEVNDGPMYAQVRHGVAVLCHWPDTAHDGCRLTFGMTDEHKRQQEYWAEAGQRAGYPTDIEVSTGNGTRLDVAIDGPQRTGIEVQHSGITTRAVKSRTTRSFRAGWMSLWSSDSELRPSWADTVPTLRATANWSERKPAQGTATAVGPRKATVRRCDWEGLGLGCKRPCGRLHRIKFELIHGLTIDEVAARMPAGELVALQYRPGLIYLTPPEDVQRFTDITGHDAAWTPGGRHERSKREAFRGADADCRSSTHERGPGVPSPSTRNALLQVSERADQYRLVARLVGAPPYPEDNRCARCGQGSDRPLVPWPAGWLCHTCAYPEDGRR